MEVSFSDPFKRVYRRKLKSTEIEKEFWNRLELFMQDPFDTKLKTHKLSGKLKGLWSFSIEYDLRIVFFFTKDKPTKAVFVDIGTHDEVY
jgi:mRNA-degrading endonuclease YafQ of YafQ-DinJ toxin-antitoxin module